MRDTTVVAMHQANGRRSNLLLAQFEFLKTRQEAMESVVFTSSFWGRLKFVYNPKTFWDAVNIEQVALLRKAQQDLQVAQARSKLKI